MRFRPNGTDPDSSICDMWWLHRVPDNEALPPPARNVDVSAGGSCGAVMDQDFANVELLQDGLHSDGFRGLRLSTLEARIAHMHATIDRYLMA